MKRNITLRFSSNYDSETFKPKKNCRGEYVCLNCGISLAFNKRRKVYCSGDCKDRFFKSHYKDWNSVKYEVFIRDKGRCKTCGTALTCTVDSTQYRSAHCDHILPLWMGGLDWVDDPEYKNLQTLCDKCHRTKTSKELKGRTKKRLSMNKQESLQSCIES